MNKSIIESIINKIAVTELNIPQAYEFRTKGGILEIPVINEAESIKGYVKCDDFELEDSELCIYDAKFFKKTLGILEDNVNLSFDDYDLILSDKKTTIKLGLVVRSTLTGLNSLEHCFDFDNDTWDDMIVLDSEFIKYFLKVASNESYEEQDTFSIKYNSKKDTFTFKIGKVAKIKFDVDGTKGSDEVVDIEIPILDVVRILKANQSCIEGYFYLHEEACRLEFVHENLKSVYNISTQSYAH